MSRGERRPRAVVVDEAWWLLGAGRDAGARFLQRLAKSARSRPVRRSAGRLRFAFDAYAEGAEALGRLRILQAKMNPDLQMPDLLKKTGAGNLFIVFGEPDIDIRTGADGVVTVEVRGLDVYDPTTGVIRSHSTEDIACWFIDTRYNEESFFVRHAYFLGGDDPYERLRKTLRTDIDEAAWSSLYSKTSRPFQKPTTGKIGVKIINHYGDEVLKVYEV